MVILMILYLTKSGLYTNKNHSIKGKDLGLL